VCFDEVEAPASHLPGNGRLVTWTRERLNVELWRCGLKYAASPFVLSIADTLEITILTEVEGY
jgi:hypothetical protein